MLNIKEYIFSLFSSTRPISFKFKVGDTVRVKNRYNEYIVKDVGMFPPHKLTLCGNIYKIKRISKPYAVLQEAEKRTILLENCFMDGTIGHYCWKPEWLTFISRVEEAE